ncbi:hypothetical protein BCR39DRAFT_527024 [Naematelia encephala]|uniref:F-box domain-containing protein n=1 Tax=Naematelia encephala TaxID=71784 RepID=A0A1Y2BAX5_9TREE|nr:hypothetical protein BCR39DRAFT_527024 [Naematelia encephala]
MASSTDVNHLDEQLRLITIGDEPRYAPLRLDRMFLRARQWKVSTPQVEPVLRPPSPPRKTVVFPLPVPLRADQGDRSPLAGLFDHPELLPLVLQHIERPSELVTLAKVSWQWCILARNKLYEHVWIRPWEENCHAKLLLLFDTLHRSPELCRLVKHLDVRFYPLAARDTERYALDDQVVQSLSCMEKLEHLVWTRDKSLNPALVEVVSKLDHLRSIEISGHSYRYYDPKMLGRPPALQDLRIMMPDPTFRDAFPDIMSEFGARKDGGLRGLALVCKSSPLVDDAMLTEAAKHLHELRRLTLWGCTRITREGVFDILREAGHLQELSLDALPHSNLGDLSSAPPMPYLENLSISFTTPHKSILKIEDLPVLPPTPNLTSLLLTLSGDRAFIPQDGLAHLQSQCSFGNLRRLSLSNLFIVTIYLTEILEASPSLEELYISVNGRSTVLDCPLLLKSGLRVLHINAPVQWGPTSDDLLGLAKSMEKLEQVGSGNRVYEVIRRFEGDERVVELVRWSRTWTPAYFQVWRG